MKSSVPAGHTKYVPRLDGTTILPDVCPICGYYFCDIHLVNISKSSSKQGVDTDTKGSTPSSVSDKGITGKSQSLLTTLGNIAAKKRKIPLPVTVVPAAPLVNALHNLRDEEDDRLMSNDPYDLESSAMGSCEEILCPSSQEISNASSCLSNTQAVSDSSSNSSHLPQTLLR